MSQGIIGWPFVNLATFFLLSTFSSSVPDAGELVHLHAPLLVAVVDPTRFVPQVYPSLLRECAILTLRCAERPCPGPVSAKQLEKSHCICSCADGIEIALVQMAKPFDC